MRFDALCARQQRDFAAPFRPREVERKLQRRAPESSTAKRAERYYVLEHAERTPGASEIWDHREHARGHERVLGFANDQIHTFVSEHPAKVRAARLHGQDGILRSELSI